MRKFSVIFILAFLLIQFCPVTMTAQKGKDKEIVLEVKNERLPQVFKRLEKVTDYKIMFITEDVNKYGVNGTIRAKDIHDAMKQIIGNKPLEYTIDKQFITVTSKETNRTAEPRQETIKVQGKVVDENGVPVPGVNIKIHGTKQGTMTDLDGRYTVKVKPDDVLDFSFIGYKTEQIPVKGKTTVNLSLEPSSKNLDEVTVVAFGSQKKESVVSAITTIRPGELKTSSSDLTSSFAGKIPGMIAWQTGGLPGALTEDEMNTKFYVRGITSFQSSANSDPLILIDGVESSKLELSCVAVEDIESFSVLIPASAW